MGTKRTLLGGALGALLAAASLSAQEVRDTIGPLEMRSSPITPENPIPRRTFSVAALYPAEGDGISPVGVIDVDLVVTLDAIGRVAEIRKLRDPIAASQSGSLPPAARVASDAFVREAAVALRRWTFDPPASAPVSLFVRFSFRPGAETTVTQNASRTPPPVRVGSGGRAPVLLKRVEPIYPASALQARVEGIVILEVWVGVDGKVTDAKVLRGIPLLDQPALDAVRQWEYTPSTLGGTLIPTILVPTVTFKLP